MQIFIVLLWLFFNPIFTKANVKYKICVVKRVGGDDQTKSHCPSLIVDDSSQVECVFADDKLHCIRKIIDGEADFGVFQPEEISYATRWNDYLSVTNEIRLFETEKFDYEMSVLVNEDANIQSLADLKGKHLCHPGFDEGEAGIKSSNLITEYFERVVVPQQCDSQLSLIENQLKSLSEYFGKSCKPGQWDPDPVMDNTLKQKYPNLCANCKNPSKCNVNDQFWGRQGALQCLSDCFGDVSWARLSDVKAHFRNGGLNSCGKISFLCPNGTLQPMDTANPCTWISRPWPAVVARNSASSNIQRLINYVNTAKELMNATSWQWALTNLIEYYPEPVSSNIIKSPVEYLMKTPSYTTAEEKGQFCKNRTYSMCVESIRGLKKCQVLSDVSLTYGIQPKLNCIHAADCGKQITAGQVDIMILDVDKVAHFKRNNGISKSVLYTTSLYHNLYRKTSAVMFKKNAVNNVQQLRDKTACFPIFDGYVWNSFLFTLKLENIESFPNNETVKNFFKKSCAIISSDQNAIPECDFEDILPEDSNKNGLWIETQTLRCIIEGGGDVAFINTNHINQYLDILRTPLNLQKNLNAQNFSTICNHKIHTSTDCPLSWSNFGKIIVKEDTSLVAEREITSMLINMDKTFGKRSGTSFSLPSVFTIFGPFDELADPMFPVDTERFETIKEYKEHQIPTAPEFESYIGILEEPSENSGTSKTSFLQLQLLIFYIIVFKYFS